MNFSGLGRPKVFKKKIFACTVQAYKDKCAVEGLRTSQAAREPKFCIPYPGSRFKEYDLKRVKSLEEKLVDLDSLS